MKILKILWCIIKQEKFIFYSKDSNSLLYKMPDNEVINTLQQVSVEASKLYYKEHIV